jgi:hypothetical protein
VEIEKKRFDRLFIDKKHHAQADKNLGQRVYTLQSGTAIVTHSQKYP